MFIRRFIPQRIETEPEHIAFRELRFQIWNGQIKNLEIPIKRVAYLTLISIRIAAVVILT